MDPIFLSVFGAWFNVDLIDLRDHAGIIRTAGVCASDLMKHIPDSRQLVHHLSAILANWNSDIVLRFIDATDTDWLLNNETEMLLQNILKEIIRVMQTLESRQQSYSRDPP